VSRSKQITISRNYQPVFEDCSRALTLLLEAPVRKEAAQPAAPNGGKVRSDEFPVSSILHQDP
jgi:hypothetical protein